MSLQVMKKEELVTLAESLGLSTDGTKADLVARIKEAQAEPVVVEEPVVEPKVEAKVAVKVTPGYLTVEYMGRGSFDAGGRIFSAVAGKVQKVPASTANKLVARFPSKFKLV